MKRAAAVWLLILMPMLTGCVAVAVGGIAAGALALHDRRPLPDLVVDQGIEMAATRAFQRSALLTRDSHIRVVSYNGVVLLAGEVPSEAASAKAEQIVRELDGVRRLVNELAVTESSHLGTRLKDTALTARVKTAIGGIDRENFDATRVKVVSVRGNIYLMGLVTQAEGEAVLEKVRYVKGVDRVVSVFEYLEG